MSLDSVSRLSADDRVFAEGVSKLPVKCAWFAKCDRPANGLRDHPVLGQVPLCKTCDEWCERMSS